MEIPINFYKVMKIKIEVRGKTYWVKPNKEWNLYSLRLKNSSQIIKSPKS